MHKSYRVICLLLTLLLTACATIMGEKTQLMPISSSPSDAKVTITDEKGVQVFKGRTPTTVTLQKSDGSYWGGKNYVLLIEKDGYEPQKININSSPNGWYIAGNLIFGGLIGWFIVDPMNGAMYTLSPESIQTSMSKSFSYNYNENTISVVLLEDVPRELIKHMVPLNSK